MKVRLPNKNYNSTIHGPSRSLLPSMMTSGRPPTPVMLIDKRQNKGTVFGEGF